ncbi:MAG TPA: hypothetical protein VIP70_12545 [Nitrososphaeraceae archaeon]
MNKAIVSSLLLLSVVSIILPTTTTNVYATQQQETKVFATGADNAAHELNLRAVKNGAQIQLIKTFDVKAENIVQINKGNDIVIFT